MIYSNNQFKNHSKVTLAEVPVKSTSKSTTQNDIFNTLLNHNVKE